MENNVEKIETATLDAEKPMSGEAAPVHETKAKNVYTTIHGVFALLALVIGTLYDNWIFWGDLNGWERWETGVFAFTVAFVIYVAAFVVVRKKKPSAETFFFAAVLLALAFRFILHDDTDIVWWFSLLVIHGAALLLVASLKESVADDIVPRGFMACFVAPFASFFALPVAVIKGFFGKMSKAGKDEDKIEKLGYIVAGICVAVPMVIVVLVLLVQDNFFSNFTGDMLEWVLSIDIGDYINPITILVGMFLFGALYSADKEIKPKTAIDKVGMPSVFINTVIISLLVVYGIFIIAQIDGYASMLMGKIPEGSTYADFARSGFFALCAVACLNGAVIYAANVFAEKKANKVKEFSVTLVGVTYLLLITAAIKMGMYISAYGFTEKRIFTLWFMVLLGVIFALAIIKLLKKPELKLSRYSVYITGVMLIILCNTNCVWLSDKINVLLGFAK